MRAEQPLVAMRAEHLLAGVAAQPGAAKPDPVLVIDSITRSFGGLRAVDVAHLEFQRGAITGLIGPNGAGKTTLFNLLTGFDRPDTGRWSSDGRSLSGLAPHQVARRGVVRTFQLTKALAKLTVLDNMRLAAPRQRGERFSGALLSTWGRQERASTGKAMELLTRFRLDAKAGDLAGSLSGGQRKLLEMARALMMDPIVVMLDEPMAGVNPALTESLLQHVKSLRDEGMTVVFVEHDMDVIREISDWVVVMAQGRVIAEGRAGTLSANQVVVDAYLGSHHDQALEPGAGGNPVGQTAALAASPQRHRELAHGALLRADDLVAGYLPGVNILQDCNFFLRDGEIVGIIGPNGAGKSTLLKAMFGLIAVRGGTVTLRDCDITSAKAHTLVTKGVGYVPQNSNVFASLTIEENLQMGVYLRPRTFAARFDAVCSLFPLLGERRRIKAGALSGGERQMVAMGRALMMEPSVLLLDEPSAGLSPMFADEVFVRCKKISAAGVSIVMVEQNARRCLQVCDRGYVLDQGRTAYTGTGLALLNDPKVIELYLGTLAGSSQAG